MATNKIDTSKFHERARTVIAIALDVGWTAKQNPNGVVILASPEKPPTIISVPPVRQFNERKAQTMLNKVMTHGDPVKVALIDAELDPEVEHFQHRYRDEMLDIVEGETVEVEVPDEPEPEPEPDKHEPQVISEKAWIAKKGINESSGIGRVYPSQIIVERKWDDGTTDYKCVLCDYSAPTPNAVRSHYNSRRDHPVVQPPKAADIFSDVSYTEPTYHRGTSQHVRIKKLFDEFIAADEAIPMGQDDPEWLGEVCRRIIEARDENRTEPEPHGPLTAEEVLLRIARLVGGGEVEELTERLKAVEEERDAALQRYNDFDTSATEQLKQFVDEAEAKIAEHAEERENALRLAEAAIRQRDEARARWTALRSLIVEDGE